MPRQAPVCDWCGLAPYRGVHALELRDDRRRFVELVLCSGCRRWLLEALVETIERVRVERERGAAA